MTSSFCALCTPMSWRAQDSPQCHMAWIWRPGIITRPVSLQADLVKDGGHLYFLRYLEAADAGPPDSRAQAAFVLAVLCRPGGRGQVLPA